MMVTILEKLFSRVKDRQAQRLGEGWAGYSQLLADAVQDESALDPEEVELVLASVDRTPEQFQKDMELHRKRQGWAKRLADGAGADQEAIRLEAAIRAKSDELARTTEKVQAEINILYAQKQAAEGKSAAARAAERQLIETCQNPELLVRQAELEDRRKSTAARVRELTDLLNDSSNGGSLNSLLAAQSAIERLAGKRPFSTSEAKSIADDQQQAERRLQMIKAARAKLEQQLAEARDELQQLTTEHNELNRQRLTP